jgi:hypothetical protein
MPEPLTFDEFDLPSAAPTLRERQGEATIQRSQAATTSSQASAASSEATAEEKRTLLPDKQRSTRAIADLNEARAEQAKLALEKTQRLTSALPTAEQVPAARTTLLRELRNLSQAKELSQTMFSASGFGYSTIGQISGFPGRQVDSLLKPILANEAFEELSAMRAASPTGGALGNVTEMELKLLQSASGFIPPEGGDEAFQQGIDDLIAKRIEVLNKLGVAPDELAEALGPANAEQFAPLVKSYRFRKEDEAALDNYVKTKMADGTFDPSDFAALMGQAYYNATGNVPDEAYVGSAVETGFSIMDNKSPTLGALKYEATDEGARKRLLMEAGVLKEDDPSVGETLEGAALNFIPSTFQLAADTVQAFTIDLPQTLEGVAKIVGGATGLTEPAQWDAVKDYFGERYGTMDGFKRAVKTDPASIAADIAGIATGGALLTAKTASTAGKLGNIAALSNAAKKAEGFAQVAAKLDPLNTAASITKFGGKAAAGTAGRIGSGVARLTGAQPADLVQAVDAGRRGSPDFKDTLEGRKPPEDAIMKADKALEELYKSRSADYTRRMNRLKKQPEMLAFDDVEKAVEGVRNVGRHKGIDISAAGSVWDEVDGKMMEFFDKGLNSIEDFDAMKRAVGNIASKYQRGTPENKVAGEVARAINKTITAKAPIYADVMGDYRAASDTLSDIKASISADAKSMDTTLGKLRRAASDKGPRGRRVIDVLEGTKAGRGLGDMLAAQNLAAAEPSMLGTSLGTGAAAVTGDPSTMAVSALSAQGLARGAYGIGQVMGKGDQAMSAMMADPRVARTAQLAAKYADPTLTGIRMANPAVQSMVDPVQITEPNDANLAELMKAYSVGAPSVASLPASQVSLGEMSEKYTGPTLGGFTPDYQTVPSPVPAEGNAVSTVEMDGREVFFDAELGTYVDAATGEPIEGFKRGGQVKKQTAWYDDMVMAASRKGNDLAGAAADLFDRYLKPADAVAWIAQNVEGRSPAEVAKIRRNLQPVRNARSLVEAGAAENERRFARAGGLGARRADEVMAPVRVGAAAYQPADIPRAVVSETPRAIAAVRDYAARSTPSGMLRDARQGIASGVEAVSRDPYGMAFDGLFYAAPQTAIAAAPFDFAAMRESSQMLAPYADDAEAMRYKRMIDALSVLPLAAPIGARRIDPRSRKKAGGLAVKHKSR